VGGLGFGGFFFCGGLGGGCYSCWGFFIWVSLEGDVGFFWGGVFVVWFWYSEGGGGGRGALLLGLYGVLGRVAFSLLPDTKEGPEGKKPSLSKKSLS